MIELLAAAALFNFAAIGFLKCQANIAALEKKQKKQEEQISIKKSVLRKKKSIKQNYSRQNLTIGSQGHTLVELLVTITILASFSFLALSSLTNGSQIKHKLSKSQQIELLAKNHFKLIEHILEYEKNLFGFNFVDPKKHSIYFIEADISKTKALKQSEVRIDCNDKNWLISDSHNQSIYKFERITKKEANDCYIDKKSLAKAEQIDSPWKNVSLAKAELMIPIKTASKIWLEGKTLRKRSLIKQDNQPLAYGVDQFEIKTKTNSLQVKLRFSNSEKDFIHELHFNKNSKDRNLFR